jgi:CDP-paratose 2-epimerase
MSVAIVTGSAGPVGAAAVNLFATRGLDVVGIDNDMRKSFFGDAASTAWNRDLMLKTVATKISISGIKIRSARFSRNSARISPL